MIRVASTLLAAMLGFAGASAVTAPARAADFIVSAENPGACGEARVLRKIDRRFRYQVTHVPNLPNVEIVDFRRIHEHRYLPAGEDSSISRRYCGATVALSDGHDREIWYMIEEGQGYASIGDNVEFCVSGFDRWMVYNGACRVLR